MNNGISDHRSVFFSFDLPVATAKDKPLDYYFRPINEVTSNLFAEAYVSNPISSIIEASEPCLNIEELTDKFNSLCSNILNEVAPLRLKKPKLRSQPWLNNETRALRKACRKAERRWKRDKLQVSYEMLKDTLSSYQHAAKAARTKYFSDLISRTAHCPRVLFGTINTVLNPTTLSLTESTPYTCEDFLNFFVRKIELIRERIVPSLDLYPVLETPRPCSSLLDHFDAVSLPALADIVKHLKLSSTPLDPIPSTHSIPLFKDVFAFIGPGILSIVNGSLSNGVVPPCLKQAVVAPQIKKPGLDYTDLNNFRPISK